MTTARTCVIALDVGGTVVKGGLVTPDNAVIGGGVSGAGETLLAPLRAMLADRATVQHVPRVVPAALGDTAGCHDAALLAWDALDAAVAA